MADTIDLSLLGTQVREMQRSMAALRTAHDELRGEVARLPTLGQIEAIVTTLADQLAGRLDRIDLRMDQTERSVEERLDRIERLLAPRA